MASAYINSQKELAKAEDAFTTAQENLTQAQAGGNEKAINDAKETLSIALSAKVEDAQQVYNLAPPDAKSAAQATLDSATAAIKQLGIVAPNAANSVTSIVTNTNSISTGIKNAASSTTSTPVNSVIIAAETSTPPRAPVQGI